MVGSDRWQVLKRNGRERLLFNLLAGRPSYPTKNSYYEFNN